MRLMYVQTRGRLGSAAYLVYNGRVPMPYFQSFCSIAVRYTCRVSAVFGLLSTPLCIATIKQQHIYPFRRIIWSPHPHPHRENYKQTFSYQRNNHRYELSEFLPLVEQLYTYFTNVQLANGHQLQSLSTAKWFQTNIITQTKVLRCSSSLYHMLTTCSHHV